MKPAEKYTVLTEAMTADLNSRQKMLTLMNTLKKHTTIRTELPKF